MTNDPSIKATMGAAHAVATSLHGPDYGKATWEKSCCVIEALIAHGWAPRKAISGSALKIIVSDEAFSKGPPEGPYRALLSYIKLCGIEVTE